MAVLINDVSNTWSDLMRSEITSGRERFPVGSIGTINLFCEVSLPSRVEALVIDIGVGAVVDTLPQGNGFSLTCRDGHSFCLERTDEGDRDIFLKIIEDILTQLSIWVINDVSNESIRLKFVTRMQMWQRFMSKSRSGLSKEEEIGLLGELTVLSLWLDTDADESIILNSWTGPDGAAQDFSCNRRAIEVKSSTSTNEFVAKIQSLEQLDYRNFEHFELVSLRFLESADVGGVSLTDMVNKILDRISGFERSLFNSKLVDCGYLNQNDEKYLKKYTVDSINSFLVDENFPALVRSDIRSPITRARYEIDLTGLAAHRDGFEEISKLLTSLSL